MLANCASYVYAGPGLQVRPSSSARISTLAEGAGLDQMKAVMLLATRSGWSNATRWPLLSYDALRNARTRVSNS
jgi:hypothetical protein